MDATNNIDSVDIAISGMRAQRRRMGVISSNVANIRTTDGGKGEPYRRFEATLEADGDGIGGVRVEEITKDMSDFRHVLEPGHPDADENCYVLMPNVDLVTEMRSLNAAAKAYKASAAMLKRHQDMVETSFELLR